MFQIDVRSSKPIYEQLIEQVKINVLKGYLKPGDSIPSVRKLALNLSITPGTVAKAYQELERQKVIVTIRGRGTFIAEDIVRKEDDEKLQLIRKNLQTQLMELRYMGMGKKEIMELVKEVYDCLQVERKA